MSNHPPHIVDEEHNLSPSAFIPFCSFAGNQSVVGETVKGFSTPVCTKFTPTVLKNQLCYKINLNQFKNEVDHKKMMTLGFSFLMDYNEGKGRI